MHVTLSHIWSKLIHDDVIKWKHFPRYWPFVRVIHRSPVNCPHRGQWRGALMFSLICAWINAWVNTREAGDLRRYRAHYDVIVMFPFMHNSGSMTVIWMWWRFKSPVTRLFAQANNKEYIKAPPYARRGWVSFIKGGSISMHWYHHDITTHLIEKWLALRGRLYGVP